MKESYLRYRRRKKNLRDTWGSLQKKKKLRKFGHMSELQVGRVFLSHTFSKKKVWTKILRVGRSDIDVYTYKSMQNPDNGDGRDLFPVVWKGFL